MISFEKHKYNKTLIVKEDGVEVDAIGYDTVDELCDVLKNYYSEKLLEEIECEDEPMKIEKN